MADPALVNSNKGEAATASVTASFGFTATAGNWLILTVSADDYKTGNPSGWTSPTGASQQDWLGHYVWYKQAAGGETSVQYNLAAAAVSSWSVIELNNISGFNTSNGQLAAGSGGVYLASYTTPSVVASAGRRYAVASIGGSTGFAAPFTGVGSWTNGFAELKDSATTNGSGTHDVHGVAGLAYDANGSTGISSGASYEGSGTGAESRTGIILVFNVSSGGSLVISAAGSAVVTGQTPTRPTLRTIASAGSAVVTGQSTAKPTLRTAASAGAAVVSGYAPTRGAARTIAAAGSAVVSGYAPALATARTVASAGSAVVTGQVPRLSPDVTLSWDAPGGWTPTEYRVKLGTTSGSYTTTLPDMATTSVDVYNIQYNVRYFWVVYGLNASDEEQLVSSEAWFEVFMPAAGGAVVTGYAPARPTLRTIASAGSAVVTGSAPSRSQGNARVISAAGAAVVSGYAPARSVTINLQTVGSAVATGYPPTLGLTRTLSSAGSAVVTGFAPSRRINLTVAGAGTAVVTGYAPSRQNAPLTIPAAGGAVVTGHTPALAKLFTVAAAAQAVVTGYAPSRGASLQISGAGGAVVTGYAPTRPTLRTIAAAGAAAVTGHAANLAQGNVRTINAAGTALAAGYAPSRLITINLQGTGSAVVTGQLPTLGAVRSIPAAGSALCAGYAPTRVISLTIADAGGARVTGYAPSIGGIDLMATIIADLALTGLSAADERFLARKLAAILAAIRRITGRDIEPKTWREKHSPTQGGVIWVSNPPIRELISPEGADHDPDTGIVCVGTTDDVIVEYEGGYAEMPADLYDAIIMLMGQAWSSRSGGAFAAAPGVKSMTLFDVGSVHFADGNVDAVLGAYADIFRYYAGPAAHIGASTLDHAEAI